MSLRKLYFAMLVTIVGLAALAGHNRRITKIDLPKANPRQDSSVLLPNVFLPVQFKNPDTLGAGKLLVASRDLADPIFAKTVILLVHYDSQGVVGLVLNRRTNLPLSRVLESLKGAKDLSDPVYLGGPVEIPAVFGLFKSPAKIEGAEHVFAGVYLISAKTTLEQTISSRPDPGVFHVYLGYAGWTDDQLRKEVELGAWFIFPADAGTVFNTDPDSMWSKMIQKTELKLAMSEPAHADPWTPAGQLGEPSHSDKPQLVSRFEAPQEPSAIPK